jgi:hypothetical protein
LGTSITESALTSGGAFTIRGVPPGNFTLLAGLDSIGEGQFNTTSPSGTTSVSVSNANVTGISVAMTDPTVTTPTSGPKLKAIAPTDQGVLISYKPITNASGIEEVTSYTVEWSTSSSFSNPSSATFTANGDSVNVWILNNNKTGISGSFTNGTAYYFRACGNAGGSCSPWTVWGGGSPVSVTAGAPSGSGYFTVTGTVTLPSTITPTGPLYVGFYDQTSGNAYAAAIASPSNSSANAYTVQVPSGTTYYFFGILDQNKNGIVDVGDVSNTDSGGNSTVTSVTGNMTGVNLTLSGANSVATVTTQNIQSTYSGGSTNFYALNLDVREHVKLPVSVTLTSGPNVLNPMDIGHCTGCSHANYQYFINVNNALPTVGDTYSFLVTYSDGTSETITASVTGLVTGFATALSPSGSVPGNTTPTFTWTDPASASSYIYQFYLNDNNGNTIWQIPGTNSNLNGFASTITSIVWGTDPTGDTTNTPSVPSLTTGTTYNWQINVQDSNGNTAQQQVSMTP